MKELVSIQQELKAPKGQYNSFGKYHYRSCEDILEAVKPILGKHSCILLLSDEIVFIEGRHYLKATATIFNSEGTRVAVSALAREPLDKKGMDDSQITGMASSYARKYALNGLFCIDDTKDADTMDNTQSKSQPTPKPLSAPKSDKPMMHQGHQNWSALLQSILDGKATLEQYKKKYFFPEADEIAAKEWLLTHQK
jgi:hypothetical protein